jgi:uncharacterized protein with NRDE domain
MCLILFAYRTHPDRPLVVGANRDEFYARPTEAAQYWKDTPHIFGGRDLRAGGTWLAASTEGRFAALTNFTNFDLTATPVTSRGDIPRDFLQGDAHAIDYVDNIDGSLYQGFNLIVYDGAELVYASNRTSEVRILEPGVYGLTNAHLDDTWPKAVRGVSVLGPIAHTTTADEVVTLLRDESEGYLANGRERENARHTSPAFLRGKEYGTRATSAVIFETHQIQFVEQLYGPMGMPGDRVTQTLEVR